MKSLKLLMSLTCATVFALGAAQVQAIPYSNLFVFGDSLADTGNNAWVFDEAIPNLPPPYNSYAGQRTEAPIAPSTDGVDSTLVPTFPYAASDRYSNGWVWPDYASAATGLSTTNALDGVSVADLLAFMGGGPAPSVTGTNFAFGGARVGSTPSLGFPFSLVDQVNAFEGILDGNPAPADALYIVEGGGNDARDVFAAAIDGDPTTDPAAVISTYISGMGQVLSTLANVGAKHVVVWNVPGISSTPAIRFLSSLNPTLESVAIDVVSQMNLGLDSLLPGLESLFDDLFLFDAHRVWNDIVNNPATFGLSNVTDACAADASCVTNPSGYLFWDGIHPTTYGQQLIAQAFLDRIPEPGTLWLAGLGMLLLMRARRIEA